MNKQFDINEFQRNVFQELERLQNNQSSKYTYRKASSSRSVIDSIPYIPGAGAFAGALVPRENPYLKFLLYLITHLSGNRRKKVIEQERIEQETRERQQLLEELLMLNPKNKRMKKPIVVCNSFQ